VSAVPESVPVERAQSAAALSADVLGDESGRRAVALYVSLLIAVAAAAAGGVYLDASVDGHAWPTFVALAAAATIAQTFPVKSPRNITYHTSVVFLVAAALLLPPQMLVLIALLQTIPEWLKERYAWSTQGFQVANYTLAALAAWAAASLIDRHGGMLMADQGARFALAGLAACVVFVGANHLLVAGLLRAKHRHSIRESGVFSLESVSVDIVLTLLGVSLAAFWRWDPWLVFAAIAPLFVVHRSLSVAQLQVEARVDPKTGLYNARYFSGALEAELARAGRFERPMAVIMADLDLLRDLNNTYGHLAGDAVLRGVAEIFRSELRHYDVAARFGGEEFSILLPETDGEQALHIAERIRRTVAAREFDVATAPEPVRATLSLGVAAFPQDGLDTDELVHQADLAVYRAKLQGRNRVLGASREPQLGGDPHHPARPLVAAPLLQAVPAPVESVLPTLASEPEAIATAVETLAAPQPQHLRFPSLSRGLTALVVTIGALGSLGGIAGLVLGSSRDVVGLLGMMLLVGGGQALSLDLMDVVGSIPVSVVGLLAGAALFDYRAALPLAVTTAVVDWSARRTSLRHIAYTIGTLSLACLAAAAIFQAGVTAAGTRTLAHMLFGLLAGGVYFAVVTGLLSASSAVELHERPWRIFRERCAWLAPHYLVYGFIGAVTAVAYDAVGLYALGVFAVPLVLMRRAQETSVRHSERSALKLREAAETIRVQNVSLEQANRLLRERSNAAMESLSATVDARDAYTAGHSRRVQQLALALGRELGLSHAELDLLDRAALFHDIGKLAVPDAILLKPGRLTPDEWAVMQTHAEEGARIIERLGFLQDAVPSIRSHHERWDGAGYPDGLASDEIPLGARIIHVADALDSMLTTRIYRNARPLEDALAEIRSAAGSQFCPRCAAALDRLLPLDTPLSELTQAAAAAS
jgi:diguanylate cyclase (GGDEF)-like protein/putative nucleotidyltransferase with HDIG domain